MATHASILAWRILWTEEPGELQSIGSQRVRHACMHAFILEHTINCIFFKSHPEVILIQQTANNRAKKSVAGCLHICCPLRPQTNAQNSCRAKGSYRDLCI